MRTNRPALLDLRDMQRATEKTVRMVAFATLLTGGVFGSPSSVSAQTVPADPTGVEARGGVDRGLDQAEGLFRQGAAAFLAGRSAEARAAFDAALDQFIDIKASPADQPRLLAAYESLLSRIVATETGARMPEPPARLSAVPEPSAPSPAAGIAPEKQDDAPRVAAPVTPADDASPRLTSPTPSPDASADGGPEEGAPAVAPESTLAELGDRIETITPTAEARQSNEAVLDSEEIDLPIELNDQVLGAIDLYTGRFRDWFSRALSRGMPHLPRIRAILAQAGLPQDLAYVPIVESAFNPKALSRAKARGLWQFIPSTGKQYGLKQDFFVDERSNIEKATVAAAQYLKNLYAMFGDWNLALAGYNAGEGNVQRAIKRSQTNDFWALAKTRSFRAETKNYVPLIHAAIVIAKSPASYGIDLNPAELTAAETVRIQGSYPISVVARCAVADTDEINHLNPELRRGMTPSSAFDLKVPHGSGELVTACLANERAMNYTRHIVKKRDTFSLIAKMFGVSASEIARVNGLSVKSRLRPGTELAIPRAPRAAAKTAANVSKSGSYRIQKGDTLSELAARHSTTVEAIKALNGLSSSRLSIGQVIRVAANSSETSPNE